MDGEHNWDKVRDYIRYTIHNQNFFVSDLMIMLNSFFNLFS